jgi:hypothetical protein
MVLSCESPKLENCERADVGLRLANSRSTGRSNRQKSVQPRRPRPIIIRESAQKIKKIRTRVVEWRGRQFRRSRISPNPPTCSTCHRQHGFVPILAGTIVERFAAGSDPSNTALAPRCKSLIDTYLCHLSARTWD